MKAIKKNRQKERGVERHSWPKISRSVLIICTSHKPDARQALTSRDQRSDSLSR